MKMFKVKSLVILGGAAACLCTSLSFAAPSPVDVLGQARFISDAPVEKIVGTAPVTGNFVIDFEKPDTVKGKFAVPVAKMKTGNDRRDAHLRGAEWLNADKCPMIEFVAKSSEVKEAKPANESGISALKLMVKGEMTINCVSQPVIAKVIVKRKADMVKIGGKFEVKLADFKVAGKKGIVGKKVGKTIQVAINLGNKK